MKTLHLTISLVSIVITCITIIMANNEALAQSYDSPTNSDDNKTIAIPQWSSPLTGQAHSVVMSDDGKYVAAGTQNGKTEGHVYLYDNTGNNLWDYKTDRNIVSVSISKSGQYIAAGGYQLLDNGGNGYGFYQWYANPVVYFFDSTGTLLWKHEVQGSKTLWSVTMSADGSQVITNLDGNIVSYDRQGNLLWNYTLGNNIGSISVSDDGSHIVTNTGDHVLYLDDVGNVVWSHAIDVDENARSLISPDGKYVLASSAKTSDSYGMTYFFDNKGNLLWTGIIKGLLDSAAISNDDSYILMSSDWFTQLYDLKGHMIWNYTSSSNSVKISSNDLRMAATETIGGERNVIMLDTLANKKWEFPSDSLDLSSIAMSKDGSTLSFAKSDPSSGSSTLYYFQIPDGTFPTGLSVISPLRQFKSGVTTNNIVCKEGFVLTIKKYGHQPACVSPDTVPTLVLRGWSENPLNELLLKYGNQTQANLVFYDVLNEPKIRDWSMKGWRYSYYNYASNGETHLSSATIHLYLPSNIGKHECENGSYGIVVINLNPVEIERNYTEVGCEIVTTTARADPELNVK